MTTEAATVSYELVSLPYAYNALEPYVDEQTMHVHRDRHHQAYCNNLKAAVDKHPELLRQPPEELLRDLNSVPEEIRTAVRNNGGGHVHHAIFWTLMKPNGGGEPHGKIAEIIRDFGGVEAFKAKFNDLGLKQFGSGWVWLVRTPADKYELITTPNQDSPLTAEAVPHHVQRRLGARVLPEISEPARRLPAGVVERGELGRDQQADRAGGEVVRDKATGFIAG